MINIKKGDVLPYKNKSEQFDGIIYKYEITVLSVNYEDELAIVSEDNNPKKTGSCYTFSEIEELFEVPKEEWCIEPGENYYRIIILVDGTFGVIEYTCFHSRILEKHFWYRTKEAALLVADQINELIKNSNKG